MQLVCPGCLAVNRMPRERLAERSVCRRCRARPLHWLDQSLAGQAMGEAT